MSSTPPVSGSSTATNVHEYLHLAPPYAQPVTSTGTPAAIPTSRPNSTTPGLALARGTASTKSQPPPGASPRPWQDDDLRGLVLEYLLSECYRDSAHAFANEVRRRRTEDRSEDDEALPASDTLEQEETGMEGVEATPPPQNPTETGDSDQGAKFHTDEGDRERVDEDTLAARQLEDARLRSTIRESILSGRIAQTMSLINTHYPTLINTHCPTLPVPCPLPTSSTSKTSPPHFEPLKQTAPCTPRNFFVLSDPSIPPSAPPTSTPMPPLAIVGSTFGSWATSLSPEILSLNLQLQSFVELMRTGHATSALSTPSTPTSSIGGHNPPPNTTGGGTDDPGMTSSIASLSSSTTSTSLLSTAIASSQALLASIHALPPSKHKEAWARECVDVCGLLAYKDLTNCPVRGYLEMSRREGLAEMVNSAILQRTNRTPLPLLTLAARSATALWSSLAEMKVQFPPATTTTSSQNGTTKTKVTKTFPTFDFARFVHESHDSVAGTDVKES